MGRVGVGWAQAGRRLGGGWAEGVRSSQAGGVGSGRADPELYSCAARATGTPSTAQPRSCAQAAVHARWASSRHRRRAGRLRQGGMYSSAGSSAIDKVVARGVARDPAAPAKMACSSVFLWVIDSRLALSARPWERTWSSSRCVATSCSLHEGTRCCTHSCHAFSSRSFIAAFSANSGSKAPRTPLTIGFKFRPLDISTPDHTHVIHTHCSKPLLFFFSFDGARFFVFRDLPQI